jgi:hypothetical protein
MMFLARPPRIWFCNFAISGCNAVLLAFVCAQATAQENANTNPQSVFFILFVSEVLDMFVYQIGVLGG